MIDNPAFYLAAVPAVLITGLAKGAFGVSVGILAVPLIALTVPIGEAAGIMLPILVTIDMFGLWAYRHQIDRANLLRMLPGAAVGQAVGTATFHAVPEALIRLLLGTIAILFTAHHWLRKAPPPESPPPSLALGLLAGGVSGFTSFVAHAGGPPASMYLLPQRLDKSLLAGTMVTYFTLLNLVKLPLYAWLGLLHPANLQMSLLIGPIAVLGVGLGLTLHKYLSPEIFYRICYGLVLVAGIKLLYDGAVSWLTEA